MSGVNVEWALNDLDEFISMTTVLRRGVHGVGVGPGPRESETAVPEAELSKRAQIVERILNRVLPGWRRRVPLDLRNRWTGHREAAIRAREELVRQDEVRTNLGDDASEISASSLHPRIWSGAASLWRSGRYHSAAEVAAKNVNAEAQNKVSRRDVSETDLFKQAFTLDEAKPGKVRLRRMQPDDSDTYRSVQRGAMALAKGTFAGVRNPLSQADQELGKQVALEYLAALSVLARWVDDSTVERAGGTV